MSNDKIKCPECGHEIPVTEVLQHRLSEQVANEVEKRVMREKEKMEAEFKESLSKQQSASLKLIREKLAIEAKKREEAEKKELELIKKQTEMEDKIRHQELEIARRLQEERKLILQKAQKDAEEKYELQNQELRKQLEDSKKASSELERKLRQGSMQTQGEVKELALEEILKQNFPHDLIEEVPKGTTGADIIQKVYSPHGRECGLIAWESKRTKNWTEEWVQKLKDDGRNIGANILVLVSDVLPPKVNNFAIYKGIWVCDFGSILGLTMALRHQLLTVSKVVSAQENKESKKDILYDYLCSPSFASRIESMVESFMAMKQNLDKEKVAMTRIWASREMQINRIIANTGKMYGEIQGVAGSRLPSIEILQLESAADDSEKIDKPKKCKSEQPKNQAGLF